MYTVKIINVYIHCIQYTVMYNVQSTVYTVYCLLHTVQCTVYSVQCTVYSVQCTVNTPGQDLFERKILIAANKYLGRSRQG